MRQKNSINIAFALSNRFEKDDDAIFNFRENSVIVTKVKEKNLPSMFFPFALKNV